MPNRDDILREKTFKDADTLSRRVYYTLTDAQVRPAGSGDQQLQIHRISKAISLLFDCLHKNGVLSDDAIDEMLFECVM